MIGVKKVGCLMNRMGLSEVLDIYCEDVLGEYYFYEGYE